MNILSGTTEIELTTGGPIWADWERVSQGYGNSMLGQIADRWRAMRAYRSTDGVPHYCTCCVEALSEEYPIVWAIERVRYDLHRYRHVGQDIGSSFGKVKPGAVVETCFEPEALAMFRRRWSLTLETPAVVRAEGSVVLDDGATVAVERLMLPLIGKSGEISVILGATYYNRHMWATPHPQNFPPTKIKAVPIGDIPPA